MAQPALPYRDPIELESLKEVPELLHKLNKNNPFILTDRILKENKVLNPLFEVLEKNHIKFTVFDDVCPNPTISGVEKAFECYKKSNSDFIIAVGGGSVIDCAKAVAVMLAKPNKDLRDLEGIIKIRKKIPDILAIPTTAGTGSETTVSIVITDDINPHKLTINDFVLTPRYVLLDPVFTATLPKFLTATTGLDALTHAVEAFIGNSTTDETERLSKEAVKLIFENIEEAYNNGHNLVARENMLRASNMAGLAFSKSYVGYVHAIAHSLGGQYNIAHGLANAVILPVMLEEYGPTVYDKLKTLAVYAGAATENDTPEVASVKFIDKIYGFNKKFNLPKKFEEIKVRDIPVMSKFADKEANPLYPVPKLMDERELGKIYLKLMK